MIVENSPQTIYAPDKFASRTGLALTFLKPRIALQSNLHHRRSGALTISRSLSNISLTAVRLLGRIRLPQRLKRKEPA